MILKEDDIKRYLLINQSITEDGLTEFIKEIHKANLYDDEQEFKLKNYTRKPIKIVIESFGGECYSGMSLVNTIRTSKTPVHTYCYGKAMSMGLTIYSVGHKRFATSDTTFMQHQLSGGAFGKLRELEHSIAQKVRLQEMMDDVLVANTKIKKSKILKLRELQKDWYFNGEKAVKLGLVDELLELHTR